MKTFKSFKFFIEEFIIEYNFDKTANRLGDKLIATYLNASKKIYQHIPSHLKNDIGPIHHLVNILDLKNGLRSTHSKQSAELVIAGKRHLVTVDNAKEIFDDAKPQIIEAILREIERRDPTRSKQFVQWLAQMWINSNGLLKFEDMNRGDLLSLYEIAKRKPNMIPSAYKDIYQIKSYSTFEDMMIDNDIANKLSDNKELKDGKADKIYEDDEVTVISPLDKAAACKYGRNTRWCTASTRGENHFGGYNSVGRLYIIIPKKPKHKNEKYQFHFETMSFMDENDHEISFRDFVDDSFPQLKSVFKRLSPALFDVSY
jgi:hypothetical protein